MSRRHIHYEAAFEDYLRSQGTPYLAVDEKKRAIFSGAKVKSFDFLVYCPNGCTCLIDVKGRKFPSGSGTSKRYWENWVTQDDLDGLGKWQEVFGSGFESALVFAYWLVGTPDRYPTTRIHPFRGQYYAFMYVSLDSYRQHCRVRSPKWKTVTVPGRTFRDLAVPIQATFDVADNSAAINPLSDPGRRDARSLG
ncbi:MAG: HYExAFE family protein [Planctomycetes bacterium]|nr:HYExAFE family protein [Planctomycetota bacterium]